MLYQRIKSCSSLRPQFRIPLVICHSVRSQSHSNMLDHTTILPFLMVSRCALRPLQELQLLLESMLVLVLEMRVFSPLVLPIFSRRWPLKELTLCLRANLKALLKTWEPFGLANPKESTPATVCKSLRATLVRLSKCWVMPSAIFL